MHKAEGDPPTFEQVIEAGIEDAFSRVKQRFEDSKNPLDNLDYHNTHHTGDVVRRVRKILETIAVTNPELVKERLLRLGEFIAANHDTVQNYEITEKEGGVKMRKRSVEKNEAASAEEALQYVHTVGVGLFTPEEEELVREATDVTIPGYNSEYRTVIQPRLSAKSELVIRAIALADLGTAGMDGLVPFAREGNELFREENIDIDEALQHPEDLSDVQKESFRKRMLAWSDSQPIFAKGREALLSEELDGLPEAAQREVARLFNKFYESIQGTQAKADVRRELSFEELARDFGYKI